MKYFIVLKDKNGNEKSFAKPSKKDLNAALKRAAARKKLVKKLDAARAKLSKFDDNKCHCKVFTEQEGWPYNSRVCVACGGGILI